jgi:hypothetical protein
MLKSPGEPFFSLPYLEVEKKNDREARVGRVVIPYRWGVGDRRGGVSSFLFSSFFFHYLYLIP